MLKKVNQKGFTIIEVLIVLAIAGLIMLIVFLAVPALQRNTRNTSRTSDASKFAAAVNQCLTNNNGVTSNCTYIASSTNANGVAFVASDYSQLTQTPFYASTLANVNVANTSNGAGINRVAWRFGATCNGATAIDSSDNRSFVVTYQTEGGGNVNTMSCVQS